MGNTRLHGFVVSNSPGKGASLDKSAAIELADTDRGLLINRLTTPQRDAIQGAPNGLLIFNSDTDLFEYWGGSSWVEIDAAGILPIDLASQVSGNLGVAHLDSGTNASSSTVWAGDGSWKTIDLASQVSGNLGVAHLNSGTNAGPDTVWSGDATWKVVDRYITVAVNLVLGPMQVVDVTNIDQIGYHVNDSGITFGINIPVWSQTGNSPLIGKRLSIFTYASSGNAVNLDVSNIQDINGGPLTSIEFPGPGGYVLLEIWDDHWRVMRGTATIT